MAERESLERNEEKQLMEVIKASLEVVSSALPCDAVWGGVLLTSVSLSLSLSLSLSPALLSLCQSISVLSLSLSLYFCPLSLGNR